MPSEKDIVEEARELLARLPNVAYNLIENDTIFNFYLAAPELLRALADEVERLRNQLNDPCLVAGYHVCGGVHKAGDPWKG